jgi:hypothetical protein
VSLAALDRPLRLLRLNLDLAAVTARDDAAAWARQTAQARHLLGGLSRPTGAAGDRLAGYQRLVIVPHGCHVPSPRCTMATPSGG